MTNEETNNTNTVYFKVLIFLPLKRFDELLITLDK